MRPVKDEATITTVVMRLIVRQIIALVRYKFIQMSERKLPTFRVNTIPSFAMNGKQMRYSLPC